MIGKIPGNRQITSRLDRVKVCPAELTIRILPEEFATALNKSLTTSHTSQRQPASKAPLQSVM
jgi:hypothetical protein